MDQQALVIIWIIAVLVVVIGIIVSYQRHKGRSPQPGSSRTPPPPESRPATPPDTHPPAPRPPGPAPGRPGSTRIRIRSTTLPPHGAPPPPVRGPASGRVHSSGARREGCPFCGTRVNPGEPFVRCTNGHTQHVECTSANAGRCALPHCTGTVAH